MVLRVDKRQLSCLSILIHCSYEYVFEGGKNSMPLD